MWCFLNLRMPLQRIWSKHTQLNMWMKFRFVVNSWFHSNGKKTLATFQIRYKADTPVSSFWGKLKVLPWWFIAKHHGYLSLWLATPSTLATLPVSGVNTMTRSTSGAWSSFHASHDLSGIAYNALLVTSWSALVKKNVGWALEYLLYGVWALE